MSRGFFPLHRLARLCAEQRCESRRNNDKSDQVRRSSCLVSTERHYLRRRQSRVQTPLPARQSVDYTATYKARTNINIVTIDKLFVLNELNNYEIFRLNYLNILSNRAQVAYEKLWNSHIGNTEEKILNFLVLRSMKPEGKKILKIKMEDLASLIDETRINVSKVLNDLQEQGLVQLSRKEISIPALEKLTEKNK